MDPGPFAQRSAHFVLPAAWRNPMRIAAHLGRPRRLRIGVWVVALLTLASIGCGGGGGGSPPAANNPGVSAAASNASMTPPTYRPGPKPSGGPTPGVGGGPGGGELGHAPEIDAKSAAAALLLLGCAR